jgi:hypothetical protein
MSDGRRLISQLKDHVIACMRADPECATGATGLGNTDIEALCDLELHLDSQDHYLTYSILQSLVVDGRIEQIRWPTSPTRPKYRLRDAPNTVAAPSDP